MSKFKINEYYKTADGEIIRIKGTSVISYTIIKYENITNPNVQDPVETTFREDSAFAKELVLLEKDTKCINPNFSKKDLKTGMFILMHCKDEPTHIWGIVVNDQIVCENGDFELVSEIDESDDEFLLEIIAVVKANSFNHAKYILSVNNIKEILYRK